MYISKYKESHITYAVRVFVSVNMLWKIVDNMRGDAALSRLYGRVRQAHCANLLMTCPRSFTISSQYT